MAPLFIFSRGSCAAATVAAEKTKLLGDSFEQPKERCSDSHAE